MDVLNRQIDRRGPISLGRGIMVDFTTLVSPLPPSSHGRSNETSDSERQEGYIGLAPLRKSSPPSRNSMAHHIQTHRF